METGASSACFYPVETEKAFLRIAELGFKTSEIFFNSRSELDLYFVRELNNIRKAYGIDVVSLHPYRSFAEGHDFFSSYKRRYEDALDYYKRYFEAARVLDAKYIIMHGAKGKSDISPLQYAERFARINEIAKSYGCNVAHENVVYFMGESTEFMSFMKQTLGNDFKMVLDVKQARRAGVEPEAFVEALGDSIVHVHLSDYNSTFDCMPPCEEGERDFKKLFSALNKKGYNGKYIIELYSNGYTDEAEIVRSAVYLDNILKELRDEASAQK